jgi:hypothetical protein
MPLHAVDEDPIGGEGMIIDNNGANPNHNCLEGKSCPSCGGFGPFRIDIQGRVTLMDDGYDWAGSDVEEPAMGGRWSCFDCGHEAGADEFEEAHRFCVQALCGSPAGYEDGAGRRLCRAHYLEVLWDRFAASMGEGDANVAYEAAWQALKDEMSGK